MSTSCMGILFAEVGGKLSCFEGTTRLQKGCNWTKSWQVNYNLSKYKMLMWRNSNILGLQTALHCKGIGTKKKSKKVLVQLWKVLVRPVQFLHNFKMLINKLNEKTEVTFAKIQICWWHKVNCRKVNCEENIWKMQNDIGWIYWYPRCWHGLAQYQGLKAG